MNDWILFQFADSALPTGGFVASAGLESAAQLGLVLSDQKSLFTFIQSSTNNYAYSTLPYITKIYNLINETSQTNTLLRFVCEVDEHFEISNLNDVSRRASRAQGMSFLTLALKSFITVKDENGHEDKPVFTDSRKERVATVISLLKSRVRKEQSYGHLAITFGLVAFYLDIELDSARKLHLFLFVRSVISAAVRLNLAGPYEGQQILHKSEEYISSLLRDTENLDIEDACQTNPLLDICQGLHEKLYSRLFNS
ncbi:hypothetical protein BKA69DRAFT_1024728 [Paraphysoderma sedebokerense]|nr:hypothetical protein BKA69DRAFT_1024728 [Paraphysoderma sedebokerense]